MYIQQEGAEQARNAPPDYSGHTYRAEQEEAAMPREESTDPDASSGVQEAESAPVGAFGAQGECAKKERGRGELFGGLGLGNLFSRVPFLSSLAPPPRRCGEGERKHSELWDFVLLAVVALSLLNGKDDDVLPLLLLLLLWD